MNQYKGRCEKCGTEFTISSDMPIQLFNKKGNRMREWATYTCQTCRTESRYARFSNKGNLLLVLPES